MNICKHCNHQIYPDRKNFIIKNLKGFNVHVNGNMYCSKDCFVMENVFTQKYQVFEFPEIKTKERCSIFSFSQKLYN